MPLNTLNLIKCIVLIENFRKLETQSKNKDFFKGCDYQISFAISEEFLKRFFAPLFIVLVGLSSSLIVTSSKDNRNYKMKNFFKFILGIIILIISEISLSSTIESLEKIMIYFLIPITMFFVIYSFLYFSLRYNRRKNFDN